MMLTIKQIWRMQIQAAFKSRGDHVPALASIQIEARKKAKTGNYSTPIALKTAADLNMDPFDLAKQLKLKLPGATVSSNAYLNFSCGPEQLWSWCLDLKLQGLNFDCPLLEASSYYRKRLDLLMQPYIVQEAKVEDFLSLNSLDYQLALGLADFLDDYCYQNKKDKAWEPFFKLLQAYFNQMIFISEDMRMTQARVLLIQKIRFILT